MVIGKKIILNGTEGKRTKWNKKHYESEKKNMIKQVPISVILKKTAEIHWRMLINVQIENFYEKEKSVNECYTNGL